MPTQPGEEGSGEGLSLPRFCQAEPPECRARGREAGVRCRALPGSGTTCFTSKDRGTETPSGVQTGARTLPQIKVELNRTRRALPRARAAGGRGRQQAAHHCCYRRRHGPCGLRSGTGGPNGGIISRFQGRSQRQLWWHRGPRSRGQRAWCCLPGRHSRGFFQV